MNFSKEVHTADSHKKTITVENLSPIFTEQERIKVKREIEQSLYDIFKNYHLGNKRTNL